LYISLPLTGNATTFCASTAFSGNNWIPQPTGNYYMSDTTSGYVTVYHESGTSGSTVTSGGCTACPGAPAPQPTPQPTPAPTPAPLSIIFRSLGLSAFNSHCGENYLINGDLWVTTISIPSLYYTTVYSDGSYTPFNGLDQWYAVSSGDPANTLTAPYQVIQIDSSGVVTSVQTVTSCGGGGGAIV
jgi:hypothetical protein